MKKVNIVDIAIFVAITLALIVGFLTYKHFRDTASKQVQSETKIAFQIYVRGVTLTANENPVKVGENAFITIRNVPYTYLPIVASVMESKKTVIPNPDKKPAGLIVDDYSQLFMYDVIVTVTDTAKITQDGAVVGGNKIKLGLPITIEGFAYKFNGTVSDIRMIKDNPQPVPANEAATPQNQQTPPVANTQNNTAAQPTAQNPQPETPVNQAKAQ